MGDAVNDEDGLPEEPPWGSSKPCPHCGARMIPIAWGFPDQELFEAAARGEVFIGGCCIPGGGPIPAWHCTGCDRDVALPESPAPA